MSFKLDDLKKLEKQIEFTRKENSWKTNLLIDEKGKIMNVINNYILYLEN